MKKSKTFIPLFILCIALIITAIILMSLSYLWYGLFILIPAVLAIPLYLTFYFFPQDMTNNTSRIIILTVSRLFTVLVGVLTPLLLYFFLPAVKESVTAFSLFIPPSIFLIIYLLIIVKTIISAKK